MQILGLKQIAEYAKEEAREVAKHRVYGIASSSLLHITQQSKEDVKPHLVSIAASSNRLHMTHLSKEYLSLRLSASQLFLLILLLLPSSSQAQEGIRLESEYKLSVPKNQEESLWKYLKTEIGPEILPNLAINISEEVFYDEYFDTEDKILLHKKAGVRLRQRYLNDTLLKTLVQVKLPSADEDGVARQEIKFDHYDKVKLNDRKASFPLWQHVGPSDRLEVDLLLAAYGIKGEDLAPAIKVHQLRRRVYIQEEGVPLATFTLDRVANYYFPYSGFTELELELNEIRFTQGDEAERKRMTDLNRSIKEAIQRKFPQLKQDQLPKYNKIEQIVSKNIVSKIYDLYLYILLGALALYAVYLWYRYYFLRRKNK